MKVFLRIAAVLAALSICVTAAGVITRIFKTRMTKYYQVY